MDPCNSSSHLRAPCTPDRAKLAPCHLLALSLEQLLIVAGKASVIMSIWMQQHLRARRRRMSMCGRVTAVKNDCHQGTPLMFASPSPLQLR